MFLNNSCLSFHVGKNIFKLNQENSSTAHAISKHTLTSNTTPPYYLPRRKKFKFVHLQHFWTLSQVAEYVFTLYGTNDEIKSQNFSRSGMGRESLKTERKKAKAKIMYKILNKMGPKSLTNSFSYKSEKTDYPLPDIFSSLCLPEPSTNNVKNSFMYDGAKLWNSIPKENKSISSFPNRIATHVCD